MIHKYADVETFTIGDGTNIWQYCVVLKGAIIGHDCNICAHVFIEDDVIIGDNVTVKSGVQLWNGIIVGNNVFIGPNVTFTNDLFPRSKSQSWKLMKTYVKEGASIGANATILAGNVIGEYAMIGAGSVITKDIPPHTIWYGNPASHKGYITNNGIILNMDKKDTEGNVHYLED